MLANASRAQGVWAAIEASANHNRYSLEYGWCEEFTCFSINCRLAAVLRRGQRAEPTDIAALSLSLPQLDPRTVYMFPWKNGTLGVEMHINTFLISREVVENAGGFDEDFCGHYGYEDVYFHYVLQRLGYNRVMLTNVPFVQGLARTEDLNRDAERNKELAARKFNAGELPMQGLRFNWIEQRVR